MKQSTILILATILVFSFSKRELVITEKGFENIVIGTTTISEIQKKYPFAKKRKSVRHVLFRTDEGRIGKLFYNWTIKTRKGITYFFFSAAESTKPIKLDAISFEARANVRTDKGISPGTSTLRDVELKYGAMATSVSDEHVSKDYNSIVFFSEKLAGKDSIDENFIVTKIRIQQPWQ